jgi:hypothetical protein
VIYEYRVILLNDLSGKDVWQSELNALGEDSWELVAVIPGSGLHRAIFVKEIEL